MNTRIKAPLLAGIALLGTAPVASSLASTVPLAAVTAPSSGTLWLGKCPPNECGRNSANVEQIPLPALNLDGEPFKGFQIVDAETDAWTFAIDEKGYELRVNRFGEFIALHGNGRELVTAMTVQRNDADRSRYRISFQSTTAVRTWAMGPGCNYKDGHASDGNADCYEVAYDVMWQSIGARSEPLGPEMPVCERVNDWGASGPAFEPRNIRLRHDSMLGEYAISPWDEPTANAVLVQGEVYEFATANVVKTTTNRWLNVACATSAIGKMKLMGYDPAEIRPGWKTSRKQRQATLKMITARYCPAANHEEFTKNGQALGFQNKAKWMWPWSKAKLSDSHVEAKWDENGATCLTLPRSSQWRGADKLAMIRDICGLPECPDFLPSVGSTTAKRPITHTKGSVQRHPSRPWNPARRQGPVTKGPKVSNTKFPKFTNSTQAQNAAAASFEGQLSGSEEWMTFNRW